MTINTLPVDETYDEYMGTTPDPVAVHVTATVPVPVEDRPTRAWHPGQVILNPDVPQQIASAHPARVRLVVKALAGNAGTVYIGSEPSGMAPTYAYPLEPGDREVLTTRHAVYATAATAGDTVAVIAEHLDG